MERFRCARRNPSIIRSYILAMATIATCLGLLSACGGGGGSSTPTSTPNPVPVVTSVSPTSTSAGGGAFTLTVNGTGFISSSVIKWNGSSRTTTFLSSAKLTAAITAQDISATGTAQITVTNPSPGGGTSAAASVAVNNPSPTVTGISPTSTAAGGAGFDLTVNGTGFVSSSVVQWNGSSRTTTFVSNTELTAAITSQDISATGTAEITVTNPAPGGGASTPTVFSIDNPTPAVSSINPASAVAGDAAFALTVNGTGFISTSVVEWNGSSLTTQFVSSTQLTASVPANDVATGGTYDVTVFTPSPGGGASSPATFTVNNPMPSITSLSPANVAAGTSGMTLTVNGSQFVSTSVVQFNGSARTTTFVSNTQLTIPLDAADIAGAGSPAITVSNPGPGGGASNSALFPVYLSLASNDLIYDPVGKMIYASIPSSAGGRGNTLTPINPAAGTLGTSIFVGSEPDTLAISDDSQFIYVGLDGSAAVRRFIIASQTADIQFSLGSDSFFGPKYPNRIVVLPGLPHTVAVSRKYLNVSPSYAGIAIYDDGVPRATESNTFTGGEVIASSATAASLYGYDNETTGYEFTRYTIDSSGITLLDSTSNLISGFSVDIKFDNGLVYATNGAIVDPSTPALLAKFSLAGQGYSVVPDSTLGRVFFLTQDLSNPTTATITAYDSKTFTPIDSLDITNISGTPGSLIRWGTNGLAFRTTGNQIFIIQTSLVAP